MHTYTHAHMHTCKYTHIHMHTYTYTHMHMHTYTYTYTHTHMHTYTYTHYNLCLVVPPNPIRMLRNMMRSMPVRLYR